MPKRKNHGPRSRLVFIAPHTVTTAATNAWTQRLRGPSVRSHAAYWGAHSHGRHDGDEAQRNAAVENHKGEEFAAVCCQPCLSPPPDLYGTEMSAEALSHCFEPTSVNLLGENFLEQTKVSTSRKDTALSRGYLLMEIASTMAVTGEGDTRMFLCLKQRLLQRIRVDIQHGKGLISLQGLGLMLLLGSPIVCLMSRRMPGGLSVSKYLETSKAGASMCCEESAAVATHSLLESHIHWRYLTASIKQQHESHTEPACREWVGYIARYLEM
jgi:hypothetical protein